MTILILLVAVVLAFVLGFALGARRGFRRVLRLYLDTLGVLLTLLKNKEYQRAQDLLTGILDES